MLNIEFDVKLNDGGRPYIHLADTYKEKPEDKFYALELATYLLQVVYAKRSAELDASSGEAMKIAIDTLLMIGDEYATLIKNFMINTADLYELANYTCFTVENLDELYSIPDVDILIDGKIFNRHVGMKIKVNSESAIYELVDGIENDNWMKI